MHLSMRGTMVALVASALLVTTAGPALAATTPPTVGTVAIAKVGTVLVDAKGLTLYRNTQEAGGKIACVATCAKAWPPLLRAGTAPLTLAKGLSGKLATVKRPDGRVQVTYNGLPLYRYAADLKKGVARGQGLGKIWFAAKAGDARKLAAVTPTTAPKPVSTTTPAPATTGGGTPPVDNVYDY